MIDDSSSAPLKQCSTCPNSYLATSEYFLERRGKLQAQCKACRKAYVARYYEERREQVLESQKAYRESHREQVQERKKQYYYVHREQDNARRRAYRKAHLEQEREHGKQYRNTNKEVLRTRRRLYRESHKEQITVRKRLYQQQSEHYKAYKKHWHEEHKEVIHKRQRQRYRTNRESVLAYQKRYRLTPKGRAVEKAHVWKRKALKRAYTGSYTSLQLQEQLKRQKGRCYYCRMKLGRIHHIDHVFPLSKGGSNTIDNIVIACPGCNQKKAAKLLHEWPEGSRLL